MRNTKYLVKHTNKKHKKNIRHILIGGILRKDSAYKDTPIMNVLEFFYDSSLTRVRIILLEFVYYIKLLSIVCNLIKDSSL